MQRHRQMNSPTLPTWFRLLVAAGLLQAAIAKPVDFDTQSEVQAPLLFLNDAASRRLQGRFLHITDIHPDAHYKIHASTLEQDACHRGHGTSGIYGAETSDCDAPFALVNATFKWIAEHVKDDVDFVVWTGDSARHDSDEEIPRTQDEVLDSNRWVMENFMNVFGDQKRHGRELTIPIISTLGNNDILPHNILLSGPNKWLRTYTNIWSDLIPEEQRHGFERGGWYYVEVIPRKLAVFSLNTLYFFKNNAAVDGCASRSEPGYEHMEWLRIQLQFMRDRGMKVILIGHVPPAHTESKQLWDETCWQKYTLWLRQYRDVVIGGLYGHMNIDHFLLHDTKEIDVDEYEEQDSGASERISTTDEDMTIQSHNDYLEELRDSWSDLPNPATVFEDLETPQSLSRKGKQAREKLLKKMGGRWAERYHVTHVNPSIVPNYFPTLRIVEYNISGLEYTPVWEPGLSSTSQGEDETAAGESKSYTSEDPSEDNFSSHPKNEDGDVLNKLRKKKKKHGKKHRKPEKPSFVIPDPPSKKSPPGPAFSPQTFTLLRYKQYFANLTVINNDFFKTLDEEEQSPAEADRWHEGKYHGKHPKDIVPQPKAFEFEVEYDTFTDPIYKLKDLTVRSYIKLAHRIGQYSPEKGDEIDEVDRVADVVTTDVKKGGKKHKKTKHNKNKHKKDKEKKERERNKVWLSFVQRAFVGTVEDEGVSRFQQDHLQKEVEQEQQNVVEVAPTWDEDDYDGEL